MSTKTILSTSNSNKITTFKSPAFRDAYVPHWNTRSYAVDVNGILVIKPNLVLRVTIPAVKRCRSTRSKHYQN